MIAVSKREFKIMNDLRFIVKSKVESKIGRPHPLAWKANH